MQWWVALLCALGALGVAGAGCWLLLLLTGYKLHVRRSEHKVSAGSDQVRLPLALSLPSMPTACTASLSATTAYRCLQRDMLQPW